MSMSILRRDGEFFYKIEDDEMFDRFSTIVENGLNSSIVSIVDEKYRREYKFQDISVFVLDAGKVFVLYKGIAQELGEEGKDLFDKARNGYEKVVWENKLNKVFKEAE